MEIDPEKIDFSKMVSAQNPGGENGARPGEGAMNMKPAFQNQMPNSENSSQTPQEQNAFSEGVLWDGKKLFDLSLDMFKCRLGTFFTLIILAVIVLIIMDLLISLPMSFFINPENALQINIVNLFLLGSVMSIITYIPSTIFGISIIEVIKNENLTVSESIKKAFAKFKRYITAIIIGNFATSGLILIVPAVIVIQIILSGGDFSLESETITWSFLAGFIGFLFVLPLLYIVEIWIFIALLGVILDNLSPLESFSYSYELFKGKASQIVWRMIGLSVRLILYVVVIEIIFSLTVGIPVGIIMAIAGEGSVVSVIVSYIMNSLDIVIQLGFTAFVLIYQYNLYENLKAMKKDLALDCKTRNQGKIKIIASLGVLLTGLFLTVLIYFSPAIDDLYRKEILNKGSLGKDNLYSDFGVSGVNNFDSAGNKQNDSQGKQNEESANNVVLDSVSKRDSRRKEDLGTIFLMIYEYRDKTGTFPVSPSIVKLDENNGIVAEIKSINGEEIPLDPNNPEYYYGYVSPDGKSFEISARLEDLDDSGCDPDIENICLYKIKN